MVNTWAMFDKVPDKPPERVTITGVAFNHAALIVQGKGGTYAAIDQIGLDEDISMVGWGDLLPDGTADGKTEPEAAIVIFDWRNMGPSDPELGGCEYELHPSIWEPVTLEQVVAHVRGHVLVWCEIAEEIGAGMQAIFAKYVGRRNTAELRDEIAAELGEFLHGRLGEGNGAKWIERVVRDYAWNKPSPGPVQ